jgi:hypothetical protein
MSTIHKQLLELNKSKDASPVKQIRFGKFVVLCEQYGPEDEPVNIRILGPGRLRLNIAGSNALAHACNIAEFMDKNPIID